MPIRIAVIGAGIIGLPTAYKILENIRGCEVTIFYKDCSPNTTGDLSAGFIYPYVCTDKNATKWLKLTLDHISELYEMPNAFEIGVHPICGYVFEDNEHYSYLPFNEPITEKEKSTMLVKKDGLKVTTWTCECQKYLPWLTRKIKQAGGLLVNRSINTFEELKDFDVIVNCAGLSAKYLANDKEVIPVRGQVFIVKAPWIKNFVLSDTVYILPRLEDVILGSTTQKGDYNMEVSKIDSERIWRECCEIYPSLKYSEVIAEKVGLRPYRPSIRVELEQMKVGDRSIPILHNYGHGGAGVTLHWGCAIEACEILQKYLDAKFCHSNL